MEQSILKHCHSRNACERESSLYLFCFGLELNKDTAVLITHRKGVHHSVSTIKHCHSSDSQQAHPCVLDRDIPVTDGHLHGSA